MKHLSNETLNALRKSVAYYLDALDDEVDIVSTDVDEYNLLKKIYDELVDLTFNK